MFRHINYFILEQLKIEYNTLKIKNPQKLNEIGFRNRKNNRPCGVPIIYKRLNYKLKTLNINISLYKEILFLCHIC